MPDLDFTLVLGVDEQHAAELLKVWPTWVANRPEITEHPIVMLYDEEMPPSLLADVWLALSRPASTLIMPIKVDADASLTQRERMLSAFVLQAPRHVETPWMLKVDTDVVAERYDPKWCDSGMLGKDGSVFVASQWGYTKPGNAIQILDDWGDGVTELARHPRLDYKPSGDGRIVKCPGRIISYVFFGRTDWLRWAASLVPDGKLPLCSQDTFHWYLAARMKANYSCKRMTDFGWRHVRPKDIQRVADAVEFGAGLATTTDQHPESVLALLREFGRDKVVAAEVGVSSGETSSRLLAGHPGLQLHMVDSWGSGQSQTYKDTQDGHATMSAEQHRRNYLDAVRRVAFAKDRAFIWRMPSVEAAGHFPEGLLDLVFVDGDHSYEGVWGDIAAWWPRVRPGGILAGHDFDHPRDKRGVFGVRRAVDEFVAANSLEYSVLPGTVFAIRKPWQNVVEGLTCPT